ncbi:HAD family hydrolase [Lentzea sp. NEAU-D7]|uniref:HAD family hydrolase n=1 Tax=Lentzea sp. NEAU-D7 TaxID=2994667 RepID=UPI00224ABCD0|nr:HAD hydrolase-like protein [Lentzea sp. NEAU-D7]MCX2954532.1 HAD hydrolase-like protein [Lentzea sp. NEAU-D7]
MARHLIWDWNGTLLDDRHHLLAAVNHAMSACEFGSVDMAMLTSGFARPLRALFHNLTGARDERLWQRWHSAFEASGWTLPVAPLADGAYAALREWRDFGNNQSIVSLEEYRKLRRGVQYNGVEKFFELIVGRRGQMIEDKSEMLRTFLRETGLEPRDVALIGDTVSDAASGAAIGIQTVVCDVASFVSADRDEIQDLGCLLVESLHDAIRLVFELPSEG